MTNRTPKETAELVEKAVKEVRETKKSGNLTDEIITKISSNYGISEKHIRDVACIKL